MSRQSAPPAQPADQLVSALPDDGDAVVNFVLHQWMGYAKADSKGAHLAMMQDVFRRAVAGERIFRSESDWQAYLQGYTKTNAAFVKWSSAGGGRRDGLAGAQGCDW